MNCGRCAKHLQWETTDPRLIPHKTLPGSRFPQSNEQWQHYCKDCWVKGIEPRANCYACVRKKIRCPYHDYADDEEEGPFKRRTKDDNSDN